MNRVLVVFSDGLLSELDSARGLVSRSAWIRQAVEDKLMKEAVAPLVPQFSIESEPLNEYELATDHATQFAGRGGREPKPKGFAVSHAGTNSYTDALDRAGVPKSAPKPKARRKKGKGVDLAFEAMGAIVAAAQIPDRCNRGACTGTINPVSGRCLHCNQTPLKESK